MSKPLKIHVIGGGPGGLYFSILMKKANPDHQITIHERNREDDTFGFGVVFSDETLGNFMSQDDDTYNEITNAFAYWDEIEVRYRDESIRSAGHGFCGMARAKLLQIFQNRCLALGVEIKFEEEITDIEPYRDADLVLAADGVNSFVRETYKEHFQPRIDYRKTKFVWLGTTQTFDAFTFIFKPNKHGWFYNHAYQYGENASTWILETHEDTWRRAGLDQATEADTIAYFEDLFADELGGHPILANRSEWRNFPMIYNKNWHHENVVLIGDAAHSAQFSIGSGTKIAMEDAIAMAAAFEAGDDVQSAIALYENGRMDEVAALQHTAMVSLQWYENARRYNEMAPSQYVFNYITRSKSITYENLGLRDPSYMEDVNRWFAEQVSAEQAVEIPAEDQAPPPPMFTPFRLRSMTLQNRVVISPMCQYSAEEGMPGDWHMVHLGGLAVGGAGLIITEMADISADGRITQGCAGMYDETHVQAWRHIVDFVHSNSHAKICVQLAHAGRKGSTKRPWEGEPDEPLEEGAWQTIAASPIPFHQGGPQPREMDCGDMDRVLADFVRAAGWADEAGFDMIELHMAHGYLLSSFISPLSNQRTDEYGGDLQARMKFPLEVLDAVRAAWPDEKPISVRISATDWVEDGGLTGDDAVQVARLLADHNVDIVDVSAGQTSEDAEPVYGRMFQTPFSDQIRQEAGVPTITVGNITTADQVNTIIASGRADLCALARPHLSDPHFTLRAAAHYGYEQQYWPAQYLAGKAQSEALGGQQREKSTELLLGARPPSHQSAE